MSFKTILSNQRGVALMMVMTAIIILMAIYGEFTFDSKISRLKATNILDRSQAKLLAESGLQMALARLRLYKEAYNKIQGNKDAKNMVSPQLLNQLWEVPFMFPIPVTPNASRAFRDTVEKFQTESFLDGEMKVSIQNISNRLNLNMLRMDMTKFDPDTAAEEASSAINLSDSMLNNDVSISQALYVQLRRQVEEKKEKDEDFEDRVGNLNYQELISNLKYYISDFQSLSQDPFAGEAEASFARIPLDPKFGPFASATELYSIPGWSDELIEMVQSEFSTYPNAQIDLNKLTANMLRLLVPSMTDEDVKDFFLFRDDPEQPKFFNSLEDFKKYIVETARLMDSNVFDERMKLFQAKGISFGSNPNLFKVVAEGSYNRSIYNLIAYVVLPTQSQQGGTPAGVQGGGAAAGTTAGTTAGSTSGSTTGGTTGGTAGGAAGGGATGEQSTQLLDPRIIEIQIN